MHAARIAELLHPFLTHPCHSEPAQPSFKNACHSQATRSGAEEPAVLSPAQLQHISTYIDILLRWNARINLTAIRNEDEIVPRHFGESLFAARHLFPKDSASTANSALKAFDLADLGSGAGFPGIPIKLYVPGVHVTLIESNHKKAAFLREVARTLTLTDIDILTVRAETLATRYDVVTLRAVERFENILPIAASLVEPEGRLALLIGSAQAALAKTILSNCNWNHPIPIPNSNSRILLIGDRPPILGEPY